MLCLCELYPLFVDEGYFLIKNEMSKQFGALWWVQTISSTLLSVGLVRHTQLKIAGTRKWLSVIQLLLEEGEAGFVSSIVLKLEHQSCGCVDHYCMCWGWLIAHQYSLNTRMSKLSLFMFLVMQADFWYPGLANTNLINWNIWDWIRCYNSELACHSMCVCPGRKFLNYGPLRLLKGSIKYPVFCLLQRCRPWLLVELMIGLTHENESGSPKGYTVLSAGIMTGA